MSDERYEAIKGFHIYNPSKVLLYTKEVDSKTPVFLEVHPSTHCNNKCIWCRYMRSEKSSLLREELFGLFNEFPKIVGIRITGGGEPLVNEYTIPFIEECYKHGIKTGIETNGLLLDKKSAEVIARCCVYIRISLDASTPSTYSLVHGVNTFIEVLKNIKTLREIVDKNKSKLEIGVSFLVTRFNVWDIPALADLKLPVSYIHFKPLISGIEDNVKEMALTNIKELKEKLPNTPLKYDRMIKDYRCNPKVKCLITNIVQVIGGDHRRYVCCEHAYEPEFTVDGWDKSTSKCTLCRYLPYNEVLDLWETNSFTKELL